MPKPTAIASQKPRVALIDADGILYASALKGQVECDGEMLQLLDISAILRDCISRVEELVEKVKADKAFIVLSDRTNFRTSILPSYKGQRKSSERPIMLDELRREMVEKAPYKVTLIRDLEADDVCGIIAGTLQRAGHQEPVIISPDKDLLQIPGRVYVPGTKRTHVVTEEAGDEFHIYQTLAGDPVDNYKGLPGYGARKAGLFLDLCREAGLSASERWEEVVRLYEEKGLTADDALTQARVSRILRVSDWDPVKKEPILWTPPTS